jgi:hypothetical protein
LPKSNIFIRSTGTAAYHNKNQWFMKSNNSGKVIIPVLLLLASTITLFPALYAFPAADDFCCAWLARQHGFYLGIDFAQTNGRWIATLFQHANVVLVENIALYRIVPLVAFVLILSSVLLFFKTYKINIPGIRNIYFSWFVTLMIFGNMPNISEMLFWYSGSSTYLLAVVFTLFSWSFLHPSQSNGIFYFIGIPLLLMSASFNEISMFVAPLGAWFLNYKTNSRILYASISVFAATLSIALISGGNHSRMAFFKDSFSLRYAVTAFTAQTLRFAFIFLFSLPLVWLFIAGAISGKIAEKKKFFKRFLIPLIPSVIAIGLPIAATGILGQHRTINYAWTIFVILIIIQNKDILKQPVINFKKLFPLLLFALFISPVISAITEDMFRGKFAEFSRIMQENRIKDATGPDSSTKEFSRELIPASLENIYPVRGWNSKDNLCPDLYYGAIKK